MLKSYIHNDSLPCDDALNMVLSQERKDKKGKHQLNAMNASFHTDHGCHFMRIVSKHLHAIQLDVCVLFFLIIHHQ